MVPKTISIIGGLDYDLIMIANRIPDGGESLLANEYLEALGGKGANSVIATYRTCHQKPHDPKITDPPSNASSTAALPTPQLINTVATTNEVEINVRMVGHTQRGTGESDNEKNISMANASIGKRI
ncbi:hypothetical protein GQ44DRAFT_831169 [Phaeosphaeriaceae sp. PMI808]|nr:hypothetical protein GQ44DRAFT_831169 [Phaeosphaeriaceae sp. PMI808]